MQLTSWTFPLELSSVECRKTPQTISKHWSRLWLGAIRQPAINWATVDPDFDCEPDLCCHMTSLGHNNLIFYITVNRFFIISFAGSLVIIILWIKMKAIIRSFCFNDELIISPVSEGIGGCYGFTSKPPAARNGVNAITQKPRDGLFSNLVYTLVVIVSWPD